MRSRGPLGPTIRRLRRTTSLLQLAELSGLDVDDLEDFETGIGLPSATTLTRIAGALELTLPDRIELRNAHRETVGMWRAGSIRHPARH